MVLQFILFLNLLPLVIPSAAANVALQGCPDSCRNISIPYPFGVESGCYFPGFRLTCNSSYDPPKLFLGTGNMEATTISLDNVLVKGLIGKNCYDESPALSYTWGDLKSASPYTYSYTRNRFTAIGCDTAAIISGNMGIAYTGGCFSFCRNSSSVANGSCSGMGCCQTAIPRGLKRFDLLLAGLNNHTIVESFSPCSYAFLIDEEQYTFGMSDFYGFRARRSVPTVLDWAVGNLTCAEAKKSVTLLCGAKSKCSESTNGPGYTCSCIDGYQGNPYLSDGCRDIDECEDPKNSPCVDICTNTIGSYICSCSHGSTGDGKKKGSGCTPTKNNTFPLVQVVLGSGLGFLLLIGATSLSYWGVKKRRLTQLRAKFFEQNGGLMLQQRIFSLQGAAETFKIFSAAELAKATDNYSHSNILGKGGSGTVFKGILPDNRPVAIKKSKNVDATQIEQFINEVVILSQVIHRNVVKILGCCLETEVPLLVYEFVTNGTLFHHLHKNPASLSWEARLRIASETASALAYLHSATARPIVHRDVKSANILLDHNYNAKVSDFGASRFVALGKAHLTTLVQGTFGYLDPEYFQTGMLTDKSDVYSFGVVVIELMTGRTAVSSRRPEEERALANCFILSMERINGFFEIVEPRVLNEGGREELQKIAEIAERCLRIRGEERPTMKEVAEELESARRVEMGGLNEQTNQLE